MNSNTKKTIKLEADLCHNWGFARYQSAFLALVDALKKENYEVTYTVNKVKKSGALEVYVVEGTKKNKVFSKIDSGSWLDEEMIINTVGIIKNMWKN